MITGFEYLPLFFFFLCWGSFLNVVAYRLIKNIDFVFKSSFCPHCGTNIAWYDLIPLFSYCALGGKCRTCHYPISFLYPFIELLCAFLCMSLFFTVSHTYFLGYFLFFSALIVSIRTDLETMLLSRFTTLYYVPVGIICAYAGIIPLTVLQSSIGACTGFLLLWLISYLFTCVTHKQGMGEGDPELMACIGAFTGCFGVWDSLMIGSLVGAVVTSVYCMVVKKRYDIPIPFGPFLALGAVIHCFFLIYYNCPLLFLF